MSNVTILSFGANLKYKKYNTINSTKVIVAASIESAYISSNIITDAINIAVFAGKSAHKSARTSATGNELICVI